MIRRVRITRRLLRWWKWLWWRLLLVVLLIGGFAVVLLPAIQWWLQPALPMDLLVVNYTMPFREDRKHRGLFWVLRRLKVKPPAQRSQWDGLRDYIGYQPGRHPRMAQRLSDRRHRRPGVLYVADTYGVYRDDLKEEWRKLYIDRSPLVFGGLSTKDARLIRKWVRRGTHLFVEFNSLCTPTASRARATLQAMLGVTWTGWIGKVFPDPNDPRVAPRWLRRDFEKQYPRRTFPSQPTLFLFHHKGKMIYVSGRSLKQVMPRISLTRLGKARFPRAHSGLSYPYWFALVERQTRPNTRVYATIQLPHQGTFAALWKQHRIAHTVPVLTERRCAQKSRCFYMAADFSDAGFDPGTFRRVDALRWRQLMTPTFTHNKLATFWLLYVPAMLTLLPELATQPK